MSTDDTRPQQARGLATVADIVQVGMKCGWQEIGAINDNGIDGWIIERRQSVDTGTIIYVQVKCGDGYYQEAQKRPGVFGIQLGKDHITRHRSRWNVLQGPAILVYVDFATRAAWWTDLKAATSYCPEQNAGLVLVPKKQRFGVHTLGDLRKLRGFTDLDRALDVVRLKKADLILPRLSGSVKLAAKRYYAAWAKSPRADRLNPRLGEIQVSRVGWRHITRRGRGLDNILQSFALLGAAKQIVLQNTKPYQIRRPDIEQRGDELVLHDYLSLRAQVIFPNRQQSVVQVVLKRKRLNNQATGSVSAQLWFYSVHEPRKGKKYGVVQE